jgi:hypothetical protein
MFVRFGLAFLTGMSLSLRLISLNKVLHDVGSSSFFYPDDVRALKTHTRTHGSDKKSKLQRGKTTVSHPHCDICHLLILFTR